MRKILFNVLLLLCVSQSDAQDTTFVRRSVERLCADKFHGRGYYKDGARKAATYIAREMKKAGLKPLNNNFYQDFKFPINTITKDPQLRINNWQLEPGRDFIVSPAVPASQVQTDPGSNTEVVWVNADNIEDSTFRANCEPRIYLDYNFQPGKGQLVKLSPVVYLIDTMSAELEKKHSEFLAKLRKESNTINFRRDKLTWSASTEQSDFVSIDALLPPDKSVLTSPVSVKWQIQASLGTTQQRNVVGFIPGNKKSDSFLLVTAHYDHLGRMGKSSIFPGANDNAAGVAMLLDLARYFQKNPPQFSMVFIAFAGEEAGLIGSSYYVQHPLHELRKTRFVLNCDLVGTGETGITVVNATVFKREFALLDSINRIKNYLPSVNKRGKAANSDHYFFSELGIPSFFWYQSGPRRSYHDIDDVPETLTLFGYNGTFRLAVDFFEALGNE